MEQQHSDFLNIEKEKFANFSSYLTLLIFVLGVCVGCDTKSASPVGMNGVRDIPVGPHSPSTNKISRENTLEYGQSANAKSECLGRLMFEVGEKEVQWPVYYRWQDPYGLFNQSFSPNVAGKGDAMQFGEVRIAVIGSQNGVDKEKVLRSTPWAMERFLIENIREARAYIDELKKERVSASSFEEIESQERRIEEWEKKNAERRGTFEKFDPGLPNSEGYWTSTNEGNDENNRYSVLRAYVTRAEHIYVFESTTKLNKASDKDSHKADFRHILENFRTRAPKEIPIEPGVCIPFGFIADNGKTSIEFKQSLRFADDPGVLYTIETGTVKSDRQKTSMLMASMHASINSVPNGESGKLKYSVSQRIGPHSIKMIGKSASQGGVVLNVIDESQKYEVYSIFSGYDGSQDVGTLPYVFVELHSIDKNRAAELKKNPSPFEQSKSRLDVLLSSIRWRTASLKTSEMKR